MSDVSNPDNAGSGKGGVTLRAGSQDLLAGALCLGFAALALWLVWDMPMMRGTRIGVGYFPKILITLIAGLSLVLAVRGLMRRGAGLSLESIRPLVFVVASFVVFGFLISRAGFFLSALALVLVACMAEPSYTIGRAVAVALVLATGATILFVKLLSVPVSVFPW